MAAMTVEAVRTTRRRTMWGGGLLLLALLLGGAALLTPYTAGVSRQHSSALNYWISGCPEDDGEAWSQQPVNGSRARQDCRTGAVVRTAVAAGAVTIAGVVMLLVQVASLRRIEVDG